MYYHRQITIFILAYFLLTSCLCSSQQPARSRRQKRGLLKMMMHIVWDPVRLIRYWYAYDVTKEIAKSWRKILPTILLLPVTQQNPHSHGFAKYVHPTFGLKDSNKKKKLKNPIIPAGSFYQGSAVNVKPFAIDPSVLHQVLPSRYAYSPSHSAIQYYSSKELEKNLPNKHEREPHIVVSHEPYGDDKNGNQYSVAHYFVEDGSSREEILNSNVVFPVSDNKDDFKQSSSQSAIVDYSKKLYDSSSNIQKNQVHYIPQGDSHAIVVQNENEKENLPFHHPGQEFHIVLHPIPINDFKSDSLKPPEGEAVQFIPVHARANESVELNFNPSPVLFKAVPLKNVVTSSSQENEADASEADDSNTVKFQLNTDSESLNSNLSSSDSKTQITWVPVHNTNVTRRKDLKGGEFQSDETARKTVSVHRDSVQNLKFHKDLPSGSLSKYNINMERLREDLKHGTPVLIPFNKNAYSLEDTSEKVSQNSMIFSENNDKQTNSYVNTNQKTLGNIFNVPLVNEAELNSSHEQSSERNATQKLILFLKRRKNP